MFGGEFVIPLFWGVVLTLSLEILLLLLWLRRQPVTTPSKQPFPSFKRTKSPEVLQDIDKSLESCDWFNIITDFLYQELRDTETARRLIMKQIKKEFKELLLTKTEGKMFDELKVREYNMGESLPIFSNIELVDVIRDSELPNKRIELIEFNCSVDYTGSFEIGIDAVMMFGRSAYVSIQLRQLKGRGRFQMSRNPFNHWSFAFLEEPQVEVVVTSRFEGRSLPRLSAFLESQFKRWIRRTHTLPNYKVRFKPFFRKYKYHDQLNDVYLHNEMLTSGGLEVKVVECSRLRLVDIAIDVYCTLSIDALPQEPLVGLWKNVWPYHDFLVCKLHPYQTIGMKYKLFYLEEDRGSFVIVSEVYDGSPASEAGIKRGDILTKIDTVKITTVEQAKKIIKTLATAIKILITVQRPTTDLLKHFAKSRGKSKRSSHKSNTNVGERGLEEFEHIQSTSDDTSSLGGVVNRRIIRGGRAQVTSAEGTGETNEPVPEPASELSGSERTRSNESRPHVRLPRQYKTKPVAVSQNPVWDELFNFEVSSSEYRYLNVCVWSHLKGEEGDIMIGYVSISLTDLAIECSLTNSGTHQQRYVLVPAKLSKIMTSRAALKVTSGHTELPATAKLNKIIGSKKYVGDITLQFRHTPTETDHAHSTSSSNRKRKKRKDSENEIETSKKFPTKPFTAGEGSDHPSKHIFDPVDLKISEKKCFICHDRIWKQAWKCKRCEIVTHLKCTNYCKKMVPCHKEGGEEVEENVLLSVDESSNATIRYSTDQDWALLEKEEEEKEEYARERTILEEKEESYSHSRMLYRSVSEGLVTKQDGNGAILESIDTGGQDVTPPESDNSSTDDEHKDLESLTNDAICMSHETGSHDKEEDETLSELLLEGYTEIELIEKINMAQASLDLLAAQKRELASSSETSMTQELREHLLAKNEAQQETTEELLKQQKQLLEKLLS